jgi:hypothetical protein
MQEMVSIKSACLVNHHNNHAHDNYDNHARDNYNNHARRECQPLQEDEISIDPNFFAVHAPLS